MTSKILTVRFSDIVHVVVETTAKDAPKKKAGGNE
jgi:hypothetical protein